MKANIHRIITLLLPVTISITSCKKDFIELSDPTRLYTGNYINNSESLKGAVTAAYGTLMPIYNNGQSGFQLFGDVASDNATTQTGGVGTHVVDLFIFDPSFASFSSFWNLSYKSIAECNIV